MPSVAVRADHTPRAYHRALRSLGVTCDVVHPSHDLSRYRLIVVATLYLCSDAAAQRVAAAAAAGAHVVVTYFSGIVDELDHVRLGGYPGAFRDLLGLRVEEFHPLAADETVELSDGSRGGVWSELVDVADGTEVVAHFAGGPLSGLPAVTTRPAGAGRSWYVATALDEPSLVALLRRAVDGAGAGRLVEDAAPLDDVDITRRRAADGKTWLFVVNHGAAPVSLAAAGHDLVADRTVDGRLVVAAGGCAVIRERAPGAGS